MEQVFFSIIIPLYNKENTIKATIESILDQSYQNFEIVVVDDGSKDNSCIVVDSLKDERIKLYSKSNGGVSSARNYGIKQSVGLWIMFFDADDIMEPQALEHFVKAIQEYPNVRVFISNFYIIDENHKKKEYSKMSQSLMMNNPIKLIWNRVMYSRPGNTILHKQVIKLQGGYDEDLSYNEDYEFSLRILSYRKAMYLPFCSMSYIKCVTGASMYIHHFEKDFVSKVDSLALDSLYKRMIVFNLVRFAKKQRHATDCNKLDTMLKENFSLSFKLIYFFYLIKRKLRSFYE